MTMLEVHNTVGGDHVRGAIAILLVLIGAALLRSRPTARRVTAAVALGCVVTAMTALAVSTDASGTTVRTRRGLPHYFTYHAGPDTPGERIDPLFLAADAAFWCALTLAIATVTAPGNARSVDRRGASRVPPASIWANRAGVRGHDHGGRRDRGPRAAE
jgi:hypothetical protein